MTREEARQRMHLEEYRHLREIMEMYADGGDVEIKDSYGSGWCFLASPNFNSPDCLYRLAPPKLSKD